PTEQPNAPLGQAPLQKTVETKRTEKAGLRGILASPLRMIANLLTRAADQLSPSSAIESSPQVTVAITEVKEEIKTEIPTPPAVVTPPTPDTPPEPVSAPEPIAPPEPVVPPESVAPLEPVVPPPPQPQPQPQLEPVLLPTTFELSDFQAPKQSPLKTI